MSKAAASKTRIENVDIELRSTSTCTAKTVAEIQSLLYGDAALVQKENVRGRGGKVAARRRPGTAASGRAEDGAANITPRQRYVVATQTVNTALKSLSEALKTPLVSRSTQPAAPSKIPANTQRAQKTGRAHSKSVSASQQPLKERPVGQVTNSTATATAKTKSLRRSSSYSSFSTPDPGLVATAECARIAFAYLGSPEAVKSAGNNASEMTLEHGRLALIGKLVTHGLDNLAVKEMRLLKKRLERIILRDGKNEDVERPASQPAPAAEKESLASLLDFGDVEHSHPVVSIITNLQIYVLRVIARVKRPRLVEEAWKYLKMSYPSNPANLISHMAKEEQHRVKAARQLESLAQAILHLCPSISSSADAEQLQPSPDIVLCLQHLAFGVRQRWWSLAQHQGDKSKELIEPFGKCLVAFTRRSTLPALKKYKLAESLYSNLLGTAENTDFTRRDEDQTAGARNSTLASLARAAELPDEALRWLGTSSPSSGDGEESPVASAIRSVRVAAMRLEACLKNKPSVHQDSAVEAALEALSGTLNGGAKDLETLFMEAHTLRRVATKMILVKSSTESTDEASAVQQQCLRIIAASIRFSRRFIGCRPPDESSQSRKATFDTHLVMAAKLIRSMVDSVSACCRLPPTPDTWKEVDVLIQDTVRFISQVEENAADNEAVDSILQITAQSPFVKFSNLYWSFRRPLQRVEDSSRLVLKTMQRSTAVLEEREKEEKEAGQLGNKMEQLGEMLAGLDRVQESREVFRRCIVLLLDEGLVSTTAEVTSRQRLSYAFGESQTLDDLGRLLKSYVRSFAKHGLSDATEMAFFDNDELTFSVRGALLESQLETYLQILSKNRTWNASLNSSIRTLVECLSGIYEPTQFPIRRQRLHLLLLQLSHGYPGIVSDTYVQENFEAGTSVDVRQSEDKELVRFADHSRAILTLKTLLQRNELETQKIQECFGTWQSIIDAATSWTDVTSRIDDTEYWLEAIQATIDLLCAKGEEYQALPVMHMTVRALELQKSSDPSRLVLASCALGLQFLRLGYSGKAGLAFAKAEALLASEYASMEARLRWHLGYAEYLLGIGNVVKCQATLVAAETLARDDERFMDLSKSSTPLSGRLVFHRAIADACYISSLLSSAHGDHKSAAKYARQAVLVNRRIWAALEANAAARKAASANQEDSHTTSSDPLSSTRDEKGAPVISSITHEALKGPDFWSLIPCLYKALMQHSAVIASQGLLDEAIYMIQQAEKVAAAVGSRTLLIDNASRLAELWIQSGRPDKAQPLLDGLDVSDTSKHLSSVPYHLSLARMHNASQRYEDEVAEYDTLEKLLRHLTSPAYLTSLESFTSDLDALSINVSALTLNDAPEQAKPARGTRTRATAGRAAAKPAARTTRTTRKAPLKAAPTAVSKVQKKAISAGSESSSIGDQCTSLLALHAEVTYRRVATYLLQGDVTKAMEVLSKLEMEKEDRDGSHAWVHFKAMLAQAIKSIADDFTFNTLPESTIAFPSIPPKDRQSSEGVAKRPTIKPPTKVARGKRQAPAGENFVQLIQSAREKLVDAHSRYATAASNHIFRQLSAALSQATVLLSAVSQGRIRGSIHPLYSAYMSELPKQHALALAQGSVEVDHEPMSREVYLQWPTPAVESLVLESPANFQHDYIDIIPETWAAVSLALSEEQDEIYITRYERNSSPFVLKLPLARHSSRDLDEEEFTFVDGKREMEEIIELSDFTTRNAKNLTTKESKKQWWEDREALDTKLRELLINIENIWLGGFKGIFSDHARQPALLSRFRKSFDNILSRHLPSRQKKSPQKPPSLDPRVLDLFIGLGNASDPTLDLDEPLTDLIYFVVDILHFNGEPNAYDEIDFDALVLETHDALRAYHDNAQRRSDPSHTILILDKNLHMLPWESLPCLEPLSISRLPSLAALRSRLLAARRSKNKDAPPGHYIRVAEGGTSILNPSGDLKHTSQTLKPHLDCIPGAWRHIRDRPPSEHEFEAALREKGLLLYFGHGSGNQYVRCKTVKKLYLSSSTASSRSSSTSSSSPMEIDTDTDAEDEKKRAACATSLLFGCSSVHLSENGIFEPSGMLSAYLTAGAPAVLGMLWDVTDRDCDRLAGRVGEVWGLWPDSSSTFSSSVHGSSSSGGGGGDPEGVGGEAPHTGKKRKGKGKVVSEVETGVKKAGSRGVGLDEAVKRGRGACKLRYLNGGAAVVYGIPVYLE